MAISGNGTKRPLFALSVAPAFDDGSNGASQNFNLGIRMPRPKPATCEARAAETEPA